MNYFDRDRVFLLVVISHLFLATIGNKILFYVPFVDTQLRERLKKYFYRKVLFFQVKYRTVKLFFIKTFYIQHVYIYIYIYILNLLLLIIASCNKLLIKV